MRYLYFAILLALALVVVACGADPTPEEAIETQPAPTPEPQPTATLASQTEEPFESPLSPLPTPEAAGVVPTRLSALEENLGGAIGQFVDVVSGEPIVGSIVYLGELAPMKSEDGQDATNFVMMVPTTSPSSPLDANGGFSFTNIEPGTYAFVLWTPGESWIVNDPETQETLLVTIVAGQITDLDAVAIEGRR